MARQINRLTAKTVTAAKRSGLLADGGGLYLRTSPGGTKSWAFIYHLHGRRREMGLGPVGLVSLADAREQREASRKMLFEGKDPITERKAADVSEIFGEFASAMVDEVKGQWRNIKHREQWTSTLTTYCTSIWERPIKSIVTSDVVAVLRPIWKTKPETASRVRGRIERVLDAAAASGVRDPNIPNPARWKGHLELLLGKQDKLKRGHHKALGSAAVPALMRKLETVVGESARGLRFTILTACRTGEALGARWEEIDLVKKVWTIPAARMKAKREHRVPLTDAAIECLGTPGKGLIFPGPKAKGLSAMSMTMLLRRMEMDVTVHGFRSSFRDWAGDHTAHPREVIEAALAHSVGDATELAYRRSDALEKRRSLMKDWAAFAMGAPPAVSQPIEAAIPLNGQ